MSGDACNKLSVSIVHANVPLAKIIQSHHDFVRKVLPLQTTWADVHSHLQGKFRDPSCDSEAIYITAVLFQPFVDFRVKWTTERHGYVSG